MQIQGVTETCETPREALSSLRFQSGCIRIIFILMSDGQRRQRNETPGKRLIVRTPLISSGMLTEIEFSN